MLQDKYKPRNVSEIIGQNENLKILKGNIVNKIPTIIYGKYGIGKTSSVYAIANEMKAEVIEINASDFGDKENVKRLIGNAMNQRSLFFNGKIILIDELEGFSGKDRGFVNEVINIVEKSDFAVVVTCHNPYDRKFSALRKKCKLIEFNEINYSDMYGFLKNIAFLEKISDKDDKLIRTIARSSNGDLRAALIDLFTASNGNLESLGKRENEEELAYYLNLIFKSNDFSLIHKITNNAVIDLDELLLYLEENVPKVYSGSELALGMDALSKADLFRNRIIKRQYYRYLVYQKFFSIQKVADSKKEKKDNLKFDRNQRILKMWIANNKNTDLNEKIEGLKGNLKMSSIKLKKEMNYMKFLQ